MGMDKNVKMIAIGIINGMFVCVCARASLSPHHVGIIRCEIPFLFDPPLKSPQPEPAPKYHPMKREIVPMASQNLPLR